MRESLMLAGVGAKRDEQTERQRNRMMRQTMGFRHAVVDAHNGDLVAVMRSPDDAYDYCDYFATVRRDATVLDLWAEI